ncbi:hypothetical protein QOZ80_7BG0608550 [Eleusine coracana subsp. coracana]|nr:hypothetical protein QOZ80_7BG0608550 [Eleusine coracana subsp. coracana]
MPRLHNPKRMPIFIGIHKPDVDKKHDWNLYWHQLPTTSSAPYVREPKYYSRGSCPEISSYGCLTGAQVCISVDGVGTYCMDTQNHTWTRKVDYVPELKLWLGFSAKNRHLAAADLSGVSTMNSQPQLMDLGKEFDTPNSDEWKECKDSQFVNLGSGMFCIARFFHSRTLNGDFFGDESVTSE